MKVAGEETIVESRVAETLPGEIGAVWKVAAGKIALAGGVER